MKRKRIVLGIVVVVLAVTSWGQADPRWWWSDRPVAPPGADRRWPHLTTTGGEGGGQGGGMFLVWSELDPAGGDWEVWLTATPNGGCSWCPPTRITDNDTDDTRPRVGVGVLASGFFTIQIVYEEDGNTELAWDVSTVSAFGDPTPARTSSRTAGTGT
jgi:hypothetical protein